MRSIQMNLTTLCALWLFGCAGQIQTNTSYDGSADFAAYRTFAQAPPPTYATEILGYNEVSGAKIQQRIANNLRKKGLEQASWEEADLQVSFAFGGQAREDAQDWGGWGWNGPGELTTENYVEGCLVIDMADRAKDRLIWHGYGTESLFSQTAGDETFKQAVDAILAKYPPSVGSK
jgi:hypothetical protein